MNKPLQIFHERKELDGGRICARVQGTCDPTEGGSFLVRFVLEVSGEGVPADEPQEQRYVTSCATLAEAVRWTVEKADRLYSDLEDRALSVPA